MHKKRIIIILSLVINFNIQAMRRTSEMRLTNEFLGLPKAAGKQPFIESLRHFANALLLQELLYNDCHEHQKTFLHYLDTENKMQMIFEGNLKIFRKNGKTVQSYIPEKPFETIEGLMALINYKHLMRGTLLTRQHIDTISLLQKSDNSECKTLGLWLLKRLEYLEAELNDQLQSCFITANIGRFHHLEISQFLTSPNSKALLEPLASLVQKYTIIESLINEHINKEPQSLSKDAYVANRTYQRQLTHSLSCILATYEQVRTQCLDYYNQARYLLLKEQIRLKNKGLFSLLHLIGNHSQITLADCIVKRAPITVNAYDSLPAEIKGLRGKDIEGIKYAADKINAYSIEDTNALFKECESSTGECNPQVAIIDYETMEPALVEQLQQIAGRNIKHKFFVVSLKARSTTDALTRQADASTSPCLFVQFLQMMDSHLRTDQSEEIDAPGIQAKDSTTSIAAASKQKISPDIPTVKAAHTAKTVTRKKKKKKTSEFVPQAGEGTSDLAITCSADFAPSDRTSIVPEPETLSPVIASTLADILDGKIKKKKKTIEEVPVERPAQISIAPTIPHDKVILRTENRVTIQDIAHNVLLHIYLPLNAGKKTIERRRITYTDSIEQWFADPEAALLAKGIIDPHSSSYNPKYRADLPIMDRMSLRHYCFVHNFSHLVDEFILSHGIRQKEAPATYVKRGSEAVTLPGHIEYTNGKQESCSYCYIFSDIINATCYHRNAISQPRTWQTQQLWEKGYIPMLDPSQPSATMQ